MRSELKWWQTHVIYQIYPRSYYDTNHDGIGDLKGIAEKLDYLEWLGIGAIWINPFFKSPMKDGGYDISDYNSVDPIFGDMTDFNFLLDKIHQKKMKLILDFVPNHTSIDHPWFLESRLNRNNKKSDWYIWKNPQPNGDPPNNWLSNFGGPAWTYQQSRDQYYYHAFLNSQPDLNWRNPQVQEAMFSSMRFWLDKGVDGFRVDVIWHIIKDEHFRDNPLSPDYGPHLAPHRKLLEVFSSDRPEVHDIIEKMRHVLDGYKDRMMVGEIYLPMERLMAYYGSEGKGVHLPFNFSLFHTPWNPRDIANVIENYESSLPEYGWPNWVLGNHDFPRLASRVGENHARISALLLFTLRGTPTLYYGEEIGMHDVYISEQDVQDSFEKNVPGMGLGRDPQRTPMAWDSSSHGGFSSVRPWLPMHSDFHLKNIDQLKKDKNSLLNFYKKLISLRMNNEILLEGTYSTFFVSESLLSFKRELNNSCLLIALNFSSIEEKLDIFGYTSQVLISSTNIHSESFLNQIVLSPFEGVVVNLERIKAK